MTILQLEEILKQKIDLNHYILLTMIYHKEPIEKLENSKVQGWVKMMIMKGLVEENKGQYLLSDKGLQLIKSVGLVEIVVKQEQKIVLTDLVKSTPSGYDYEGLQKRLKEELKRLTGNSQFFLKVQGNVFPYLPGVTDLKNKLEKFKSTYKLNDMSKIEKCLMRHLTVRNQKMIYYIMRERGDAKSDLASDYENFNDLPTVSTPTSNNRTTNI